MKTTFTPGPWRSKQEYANRWRIEQDMPNGATPFSVALVTTTVLEVGSDNDTAPANARLIAAAPELLAALQHVYNNISNDVPHGVDMDIVHAAVAKALVGAA